MKILHHLLIYITFLSTSFGAVILSEDFDSYDLGQDLVAGNDTYTVRNKGIGGTATASTIGSGNSLTFGGATSSSAALFHVDYGQEYGVTTNIFSFKTSGIANGDFVFYEGESSSQGGGSLNSNSTFSSNDLSWAIMYDTSQNRFEYRGSGWSGISDSPTLVDDTQYDVHIVANNTTESVLYGDTLLAADSMDFYLNGTLIAGNLAIRGSELSSGFKFYQVGTTTAPALTIEFDNHQVYDVAIAATPIPEKSSVALVVGIFGITCTLLRRQRVKLS